MKSEFIQSTHIPAFLGLGLLLALASCGAGHVGETWQCPLAQGSQCTSIESADPAIRPAAQPAGLAPLVLDTTTFAGAGATRPAADATAVDAAHASDDGGRTHPEPCRASCNPASWLWRWLTGGERRPPTIADDVVAGAALPTEIPADTDAVSPGAAATAESPAVADTDSAAESQSEFMQHSPVSNTADVRVPEKIGRVWIAPWVDASGVYREGAWVRIVLSPARWRRSP